MSEPRPKRRWLAFLGYSAISIALLVYVIRSADWGQLDLNLHWGVLLATLSLSLVAYFCLPTLRWQWVLRGMNYRPPFGSLVFARVGSQPLKFAIPLRGGEAFRAVYLRKRHGIPNTHGLGSVLFDLSLVAAAQLTLLCVGLLFLEQDIVALWVPLLVLFVLCVAVSSTTFQRAGLRLIGRFSARLREKAEGLAHPFLELSLSGKWALYLFSIVVEAVELGVMALCFRSFGIEVSLVTVCTVMPVVVFISLLPVTVGGFGTRELAIVTLFSQIAAPATLASVAFLFSAVEVILPALIGCAFMPGFLSELNQMSARSEGGSDETIKQPTS